MNSQQQKPAMSRRTFLAGTVGTTLVMGIGSVLPGCSREDARNDLMAAGASNRFSPAVWFEISGTGEVLINIAKAEMGQHVGTALARIVADELGADWSRVSIKHVDTDPKWGYMITGGSWSVVNSFTMLSQAGAAGRTILIEAGAALMGVEASTCTAENGHVSGGDQQVSFAEIVATGDISRVITEEELAAMPVKPAADRRLIGSAAAALDIPEKSMGEAVYGLDVELPGMVYAHPLIPPTRYGSAIDSIDDSAARDIPGYQQTLQINDPSSLIQGWALVIADNFPTAMKAAQAVEVEWAPGTTGTVNEAHIMAEGDRLVSDQASGVLVVDDGDVANARESSADTFSATYRTSTALHFTLEPQNALVEYVDGVFHIHAGNQWQSLILPYLASALEVPESNIVIHQYYLGGGYGRRLFGDQMIPAALAARELGRPVKLVFQRNEDSRFDCVRSPSVAKLDASFDADKTLTGIEHAIAAGWPTLTMAPGSWPMVLTAMASSILFQPVVRITGTHCLIIVCAPSTMTWHNVLSCLAGCVQLGLAGLDGASSALWTRLPPEPVKIRSSFASRASMQQARMRDLHQLLSTVRPVSRTYCAMFRQGRGGRRVARQRRSGCRCKLWPGTGESDLDGMRRACGRRSRLQCRHGEENLAVH